MPPPRVQALHMKHLLAQQGYEVEIVFHSDASAAIGAYNRLGAGKCMKHSEIQDLWIQQLVRNKFLRIKKISTHENPVDIVTKHVGRGWLDKVRKMCNIRFPDEEERWGVGRSAPTDEPEEMEVDVETDEWNQQFQSAAEKLEEWYHCG